MLLYVFSTNAHCLRMCLCLCGDLYSVTVCPLSASEYVPTLPAAPPWQRWEGQASTNAAEGGDGGLEASGSTLSY